MTPLARGYRGSGRGTLYPGYSLAEVMRAAARGYRADGQYTKATEVRESAHRMVEARSCELTRTELARIGALKPYRPML